MSFEDIIDKVKTQPEIWQRAHPLYKNKTLRLRIWKRISKELDTEAEQLKKSWKYLNDQYRREYKKIKSYAPYEGKPIPCGWAYYDRLSFLLPEMTARRDRRIARPPSSDSEAANDSAMTQDFNPTMTQDATPESFQEDKDDPNYENFPWKYNVAKQSKQAIPGPGCSSVSKADLILRRLQYLTSKVENSQSDAMKNNEDFMFFMSIMPMVKTLSPVRKLQLRGKINEWLLQTLTGDADPLNNIGQYVVPVEESCEDNKEAVLKQILMAEDDD